jgi:hypothetical protein
MGFLSIKYSLLVLLVTVSISKADRSLYSKVSEKDGKLKVEIFTGSSKHIAIALTPTGFNYKAEIRYRIKGKANEKIKLVEKGQNIWVSVVGRYGYFFLEPQKKITIGPSKRLFINYSLPDKDIDLISVKVWIYSSSFNPNQSIDHFINKTIFKLNTIMWKDKKIENKE